MTLINTIWIPLSQRNYSVRDIHPLGLRFTLIGNPYTNPRHIKYPALNTI